MVNPVGRPRTTTPNDEELIELGKDLLQWATEETDELRCRFPEWYCLKQGFIKKQWDLMLQKETFRSYYEMAQAALAKRYMNGTINPSIAHRFLRIYTPEVKDDEDTLLKYQSDLKAKEELAVSEADVKRHDSMMEQLREMRKS